MCGSKESKPKQRGKKRARYSSSAGVGAGSGRPKTSNSLKAFLEDRAKKLAEKENAESLLMMMMMIVMMRRRKATIAQLSADASLIRSQPKARRYSALKSESVWS